MSKSRFTTTDVQAMVRDIRAHTMGQRVANVYDLSEKCYLLKFAIPGKSAKITLLLESGIRFHTTKYSRDLPELPSAFAMKLRKFIRTKRLEDVRQIGIDRVVDFKFGSGDAVNHLILELYANGNIVLTDGNYEVIALLRSHQFEDDVTLKVGEVYPIAYTTNVSTQSGSLNKANIDVNELAEDMNNLQMGNIDNIENTATHSNSSGVLAMTVDEFKNWAAAKLIEFKEFHAHEELVHAAAAEAKERELAMQPIEEPTKANMTEKAQKKAAKKLLAAQMAQAAASSKKKKTREMTLKQLLLSKGSGVAACGPEVLDHCLLQARIKPSSRVDTISDMPGEDVERMLSELSDANRITERLNTPGLPGFIVYKNIAPCKATPSDQTTTSTHSGNGDFSAVAGNKEGGTREVNTHTQDSLEFIEFLPMLFEQHSGRQVLTYPSFDEAVDEYYSKIEGQRLAREAQAAEIAAEKKIEKIKRDQEKMQKSLIAQQERMQRGASLLETYAEEVDKVALVINSALGAGMAWEDIGEMVKAETAAGNPIASLISRLDLQRNRLWVKLRDNTSVTSSSSTPASLLADPLSNYNNNEDFSEELVEGGFVKVTSASVPHNMSMSGGAMKNEENKDAELDMFSSDSEDEVKSAKSTPVALANTAANTAATATETGSPATVAAGVKSDASHTHPKSIAKDTATTSSTTKTPMPAVRGPTTVEVELDLSLSAYANARKMYSQKKIAYAKEAKTVEASSKVLQQVGERVLQGVESQKLKKNLKAVRKVHWFEKFNWCISSEGYLILSGRDAQQNEILFKRYMRPSDIYVHADIPGAATCIVRAKNPSMLSAATGSAGVGNSSSSGGHSGATSASGRPPAAASAAPNRPISPMAIQEAGMMAVSRSNAWKGKIGGVAAWWVWANQVSKTAPSGEYLTTGSFMILGKKNFLPPMALEMGFGVMFRLDDASVPRHMKDWKDRSYLNDEKSMTVFTDNLDRYAVNFQELGPNALCLGDSGDENEDDLQQRQYHNDENSDGAVVHDCPALRLNDESIAPLHSSKESSDAHALLTSTSPLSSTAVLGKKELRKAARAEKMKKAEEEKGKGKKKEKKDKDSGNKGPSVEEADQENQIEDEEEEEEEDEDVNFQEYSEASEDMTSNSDGDNEKKRQEKGREVALAEKEAVVISHVKGTGGKQSTQQQKKNVAHGGGGKGKKGSKGKGGKGRNAFSDEDDDLSISGRMNTTTSSQVGGAAKKKHLNKKKARRYAEQDEEDRELAMLVLGHASAKTGERLGDKTAKLVKEKKSSDLKTRQEKAGVGLVTEQRWEDLVEALPESVRAVMEGIISGGFLKAGEIDAYEMRNLANFPPEQGVEILYLFSEGSNLKKAGNKSGFLAGIMRRFASAVAKKVEEDSSPQPQQQQLKSSSKTELKDTPGDKESSQNDVVVDDDADVAEEDKQDQSEEALSRRARKKQEQDEIRAIMEAEGFAEEDEGKHADEVEKLTGCPVAEDVLLYAVPVCGPYASMQNFKYKVKLTPGVGKKGKICKQSIELFTRARECSAMEKALMSGLTDPEMVSIMISDCRLSMPGLQQLQAEKRVSKKSQRGQKK